MCVCVCVLGGGGGGETDTHTQRGEIVMHGKKLFLALLPNRIDLSFFP